MLDFLYLGIGIGAFVVLAVYARALASQ